MILSEKTKRLFAEAPQIDLEAFDRNTKWLEYGRHSLVFSYVVKTLMKAKGMTQKELASKLEVSEQVVSKWLSGKENLTLETISNLERALGKRLLYAGTADDVEAMIRRDRFVEEEDRKFEEAERNKAVQSATNAESAVSHGISPDSALEPGPDLPAGIVKSPYAFAA